MKPEVQVFLNAVQLLEVHAELLDRIARQLDETRRANLFASAPEIEAHEPIGRLLREAAMGCRRRAGQIEKALAEARSSSAFALVTSAMGGTDRLLEERRPDVDVQELGVPSLYQRLMPIYDRAADIFEISPDSNDDLKFDEFSRWLAENPHPWAKPM